MKMGPKVYYAPEGAPAGAADGSGGKSGQPESTNATGYEGLAKWQAQLPKEMRGNEAFAGINDLGTLGSNYIRMATELAELKAAKQSNPENNPEPEKKTDPVKYENFSAKLGTQFDPDGFVSSKIAEYLQGKNMPQKDAEDFIKNTSKYFEESLEQMQKQGPDKTDQYNRQRWDKDYDANVALSLRALQAADSVSSGLSDAVEKSGLKIFPAFWDFLCAVGNLIAEDSGTPHGGAGKKSGGVPVDYSKPSV